ncbi:MAG: nucleoside kinase [Bacteroidaceae bacterium]|nr:nucleoside kinase [Bacteroidaceae bacterium]
MIQIKCKNNGETRSFEFGTMLTEIYDAFGLKFAHKPVCALVNNRLEGLRFRVFGAKTVEFLDLDSAPGRKVYMRSLTFVLYKAVRDLYPGGKLMVEAPVSKGYFFKLALPASDGNAATVTLELVQQLKQRMEEIIAGHVSYHRLEGPTEEVVKLFRDNGLEKKAKLIEGLGNLYSHYYKLDDTIDYYYGPLVPSTDYLWSFDLVKYYDGVLLRIPQEDGRFPEIVKQEKMLNAFALDHQLLDHIGVSTVGQLNELTRNGFATETIMVAEALQEKRISQIAEQIAARKRVKVILVAGPSSSGKTTFSKRLCVQLMTCGMKPRLISLDDYFVDREKTPIDENGEYDYESIYSLNLDLYNQHIKQLLNGEEVELPTYNFAMGKSMMSGKRLRLDDNMVLLLEGIHGLNPLMSEPIPEDEKFRIYISALTAIKLDDHNYIPTTDSRLIRRIVRDNQFRGASAIDTIARWPSVRRGEDKWIFPFQENADVMFNSALIYELAVLRNYALPLLESVYESRPEHGMANALSRFLSFFEPISDKALPPTSLLREFLGGSSFKY